MKRVLFLAALVLCLVGCNKETSREVVLAETPEGRPFHFMPIYEDGVTDITITVAWPTGWAYRPELNPAVPYVAAEAILSGGTKQLAPQDVMELFNDKNSRGHFYVRANHAIGELSFPKEHIDDVVSIASEMLASPQFDQAWVDRVKRGIFANQTQSQTQTAHQMWALARQTVLGQGPLNNYLSLPNLDDINAVSVDDLRRWHAETVVQDAAAIAVTGAISREDAGKVIDQLVSSLQADQPKSVPDVDANFAPKTILLHLPEAEKTTLGLLGQLPSTSQGGDLVDLLALGFFERSGSGPLFDAVRTDLRASYGFQAGYSNYDRANRVMFVAGEVETAKLAQATDVIRTTYESYRTAPDFTGFDEFRRGIAGGFRKNVLYVDVAARTILEFALDARDPSGAPDLGDYLDSITAQTVQERLASVYPSGDDLIVVAASPDASALPGACVVTAIEQVAQCP
ncbi:MAG: M16 family metallopeptidase [Pelagimonas sp.]|uniref:M16 family metallopeptidase n=1 Tax=Pelagimonas sp. TaxID=2073170 RepID=UPI003D6C3CA9